MGFRDYMPSHDLRNVEFFDVMGFHVCEDSWEFKTCEHVGYCTSKDLRDLRVSQVADFPIVIF